MYTLNERLVSIISLKWASVWHSVLFFSFWLVCCSIFIVTIQLDYLNWCWISIRKYNQKTWIGFKCKFNSKNWDIFCHLYFYFEMLFCRLANALIQSHKTRRSIYIFFFLTWQFGWATRLLAAVSSKIANAIIETSMKKKSLFHRIILIYIAAWNWYGQSDQIFRNIHEIGIFCHHNDNDSPLASRHQSFQYIKSIFFLVLFHFDDFLTLWQRFFFSIKYKYKWKQNSTKQNNIVLFSCSTIFESCMINVERETGMRNKQKMTKN